MIPRRNHGDGSDCSLCSLHDGDHRSLQVAQKRSLFGYKIHKIELSEALKTTLEMSPTAQKSPLEAASGGDTPRDRFWTNFGPVFGRDFEVQIELRRDQKSSSRMHMLLRPRLLVLDFSSLLSSIWTSKSLPKTGPKLVQNQSRGVSPPEAASNGDFRAA